MPNVAILPLLNPIIPPLVGIVDGYPTFSHKIKTTAGGAPLENGAHVTDHKVADEREINLEGWVSSFTTFRGASASIAWQQILRLWKGEDPVMYISPFDVIDECLIMDATATPNGLGMRFTMKLQEVLRVGIEESAITEPQVAGGPAEGRTSQVERGRVTPPADPPPQFPPDPPAPPPRFPPDPPPF